MTARSDGVEELALPDLARRIGNVRTHMVGLGAGALAFLLLMVIRDQTLLLVPMALVGVAWASILGMPYLILTRVLPPAKVGIYIGLFNLFIVVPQLVAATLLGLVLKHLFEGQAIYALLIGTGAFTLAALASLRVRER